MIRLRYGRSLAAAIVGGVALAVVVLVLTGVFPVTADTDAPLQADDLTVNGSITVVAESGDGSTTATVPVGDSRATATPTRNSTLTPSTAPTDTSSDDPETSETTATDAPGFGVAAALVALLGAVAWFRRR